VVEADPASDDRWRLSEELEPGVVEFVGETMQAADAELVDAPTRQITTSRGVGDGTVTIRLWSVGSSGIPVEPVERAGFEVTVGSFCPSFRSATLTSPGPGETMSERERGSA